MDKQSIQGRNIFSWLLFLGVLRVLGFHEFTVSQFRYYYSMESLSCLFSELREGGKGVRKRERR